MQLLRFALLPCLCLSLFACSSNSSDDDDDLSGDSINAGDNDGDGDGDSGDSDNDAGPCTSGQTRCDGYDQQECQADGGWAWKQTCPYVCIGGTCTGECSPQLRNTCCVEREIDGVLNTQCSQHVNDCTGGPGCDNPARVYIRTCNNQGHYVEFLDCEISEWTGNEGTSAETIFNLCGICEETDQLSCINGQTLVCKAGP